MKVINYMQVPLSEADDLNRDKTTWRGGKIVMADEGRHVTLYLGHMTETVSETTESGEVEEHERMTAFPVRVEKPLTREKAVNAALMQAYALATPEELSALRGDMQRKWRANNNDRDVAEYDSLLARILFWLDATGLFAGEADRVDDTLPTLSDLMTLCTALARSKDIGLTDTKKAKVRRFFPTWDELLKKGEQLPAGTELQYGGDYYKVIQAHTPQADWKPSEQHALYAYVSSHDGTLDDPIPYRRWMLLEKGKYYTQFDVLYLCTTDSIVGYDEDLAGLAALVTVVDD